MKQQIIECIEKYQTIIIHRHVRPDEDAYGSQMGLATLIQSNYPEKTVSHLVHMIRHLHI